MVCARYTYDAWGKCTVDFDNTLTKIADVNPFRYRGYYYDNETGLYYLQSRYYDPKVGRFVCGDSVEWLGTNGDCLETNIFAYCCNDCINESDEIGFGSIKPLLNALKSSVDVVTKIIDMIGKSYNKQKNELEASVKRLTKKQTRTLSNIRNLQEQSNNLSKKLGWIGNTLTFLTIIVGFSTSYKTGKNIDNSIVILAIDSFIALLEYGAEEFFKLIASSIPYIGILLRLIAGWVVSYLIEKYFTSSRVYRIQSYFSSYVKNVRISLFEWTKGAAISLIA